MRWGIAFCVAGCAAVLGGGVARSDDQLGFQWSSGMRLWQSTGNTNFEHFDEIDGSLLGTAYWNDISGTSAETFFRGDQKDGLFVKAVIGGGSLTNGTELDDFSRFNSVPTSEQRSGSVDYFSGDVGYSFLNDGANKLGAFVGYSQWRETMHAFGCQQLSTSSFCDPAILGSNEFFTHEFGWNSWRIGLSGRLLLTPELSLEAEAAYLAHTTMDGTNRSGLFNVGSVEEPLKGKGGDGAQLEASLNYQVSDALSLGFGGRYWRQNKMDVIRDHSVHGGLPQRTTVESERLGFFVQGTLDLDQAFASGLLNSGGIAQATNDWSGAYGGVFLGQGFGSGVVKFSGDPDTQAAIDSGILTDRIDVKRRGLVAGVQGGYNFVAGQFLFGVEGDAAWSPVAGVDENTNAVEVFDPFLGNVVQEVSVTAEQSSDWLATLRARAGLKVTDQLLVYGTGGLAVGETRLATNGTAIENAHFHIACEVDRCVEGISEGVSVGYALGAGYEYEVAPGTRWKTDYIFTDLGKRTARIVDPNDAALVYDGTAEFKTHAIRSAIVFDF